ncbi:hypothetical protein M422DRAFT_269837 [Sphaerobolus stellatus SS14]|uniref:Uncharacterized protein n=1 Tax=Sphaerobolus stellatus (strain SS14) TaxID=990650 RepID=A0A0C9UU74_SPHS4|nr:hypothetical protein M422DRAFT_269837 [Sphaerobolus stellatus SS14]
MPPQRRDRSPTRQQYKKKTILAYIALKLTQEEESEGACLPVLLYAVRIPRLLPGVPTGVLATVVAREERTSKSRPEIGGRKIDWEYLAEMTESQCEWAFRLPNTGAYKLKALLGNQRDRLVNTDVEWN